MRKVAVLTNDLQYDLVNKSKERRAAVDNVMNEMVAFYNGMRKLNVPIVHLQLICDPNDPTVERVNGSIPVQKGSEGAQILKEFLHESDFVLEKRKDSGFFETNLDATLKSLGIESVIITGMQTQICVQTTAADAFFRGYKVIVPRDAVVSSRIEDKQRALDWLGQYFAIITTCDEVQSYLSKHDDYERKPVSYA